MVRALSALERLRAGNRRFAAGEQSADSAITPEKRTQLVDGQQPFAIVYGCSDSRVPAELVFDQGLGDLFVIRVAGNVVAPSLVGSVEFAAARFGTRLVVVLGHTQCGAVTATVEELLKQGERHSKNIQSIVDRIRPSVQGLIAAGSSLLDPELLVEEAVRANVRASANQLRHGSAILEELGETDGLLVVGAEYSLATGLVDFFDGVPEGG